MPSRFREPHEVLPLRGAVLSSMLGGMSDPVEKEECVFIGGRAANGVFLEVDPNEEFYHVRFGDGSRPSVHPVKVGPDGKFPRDGKGYDRFRRYRDPSRTTDMRFYCLHRFSQGQVNALIANAVATLL